MNDYTCPDCGFVSSGHDTKKAAAERGREHKSEHASTTERNE